MKLDFKPYRPNLYGGGPSLSKSPVPSPAKVNSVTKPKAVPSAKPKQLDTATPIVAPSVPVGTSAIDQKDALALLEKIRAQTRERVRRCREKKALKAATP